MKKTVLLIFIVTLYLIFMNSFTSYMINRPQQAKLGFTPQGKLYKYSLGEFRWFAGEYLSIKATVYYGGKEKILAAKEFKKIEYFNLFKMVQEAINLNPYNEDAYYFAQATFTWNVGHVKDVNFLLKHVFKYRKWDFKLPFFIGFNYAYFLKDYKNAAYYFKRAAEISGSSLFTNLAARYFYEGGRTKLGIIFLKTMIKAAHNSSIKSIYKLRLDALSKIASLARAVNIYKKRYSSLPENLQQLVDKKIIDKIPVDPYGGKFYISGDSIKTTSNLAKYHKKRKNGSYRNKKSS